jgi:type VI secretion system protein ImpC
MFPRGGGAAGVDRRAADGLIGEIDRYLSRELDRVLHHSKFTATEQAWRGLKFLIDRIDFREAIRVEIAAPRFEDLPGLIEALAEEGSDAAPVAAVVTGFEVSASVPELDILRRAAEAAARLQAPVIAAVTPEFFGKTSADEAARISNLKSHLEAPEYVKWHGLAEAEESRWLGLAFNRFLLRPRHEPAEAPGPAYHESSEGLWGSPAWAIGTLLARSFARAGWAGHITGARGGGLVEDLRLRAHRLPSGDSTEIPLETIFLKDRQYDFYECGFMVLQCGENQDVAVLMQAPTVHAAEQYSDARETEVSRWRSTLTYQMVASRFVQHLTPLLDALVPSGSPTDIREGIERGLRKLAKVEQLDVRLQDSRERPGFMDLSVRIRPGAAIWTLPIDIDLHLPIRKR